MKFNIKGKFAILEKGILMFSCPACKQAHQIQVGKGDGPRWGWNGDYNSPTFTPSLRVKWYEGPEHKLCMCHSFITDGRIQFLGDSTHVLAKQTVDLPEWQGVFG